MTWNDAVNKAISSQIHLPYGRSKAGSSVVEGATKACFWGTTGILRAGTHTSCVYSVMETILDAAAILGLGEDDIPAEDMQELKRWCFVYDESKRGGIGEGLAVLDLGDLVTPQEARAGDCAQIWDTNEAGEVLFGHCVIITGREEGTPSPAFSTYSAEPNEGNCYSWRYIEQPNPSKKRQWIIGRPDFQG